MTAPHPDWRNSPLPAFAAAVALLLAALVVRLAASEFFFR